MTLNITGGNVGCVGTRYAYTPVNIDQDGGLTATGFRQHGRDVGSRAGAALLVSRRRVPEGVSRGAERRHDGATFGCAPGPGSR